MKKVTNIMFSVMFVLCFTLFLQNNVSGAQKIQVQFNANGGYFLEDGEKIENKKLEIDLGDSVDISKYTPSRDGYKFKGWKRSDSTSDTYFTSGTSSPNSNIEYIAGWEEIPKLCKVEFDANGGSLGETIDGDITIVSEQCYAGEVLIYSEETMKHVPLFVKEPKGYFFIGWREKGTDDTNVYLNYTVKKDVKLEAVWAEECTVTYEDKNGRKISEYKIPKGSYRNVYAPCEYMGSGRWEYYTFWRGDVWKVKNAKDNRTYESDEKYLFSDDVTFVRVKSAFETTTARPNHPILVVTTRASVDTTNINKKNNINESKKKSEKIGNIKKIIVKKKKKSAKLTWSTVRYVEGYRVQVSTNKKFKKAKTYFTRKNRYIINNSKKYNKFYVRICAYKYAKGKKKYGKNKVVMIKLK